MNAIITSTDTFDLTDSSIVFEWRDSSGSATPDVYVDGGNIRVGFTRYLGNAVPFFAGRSGAMSYGSGIGSPPQLVKVSLSGTTLTWSVGTLAGVFTEVQTQSIAPEDALTLKSARVVVSGEAGGGSGDYSTIGSVNYPLAPSSTGNFLAFFLP